MKTNEMVSVQFKAPPEHRKRLKMMSVETDIPVQTLLSTYLEHMLDLYDQDKTAIVKKLAP